MLTIHPDAKGLIFDCDGTLADTMPAHQEAWRLAFEAFGITISRTFLDESRGMPARHIVDRYNRENKTSILVEDMNKVKQGLFDTQLTEVRRFDAVTALVEAQHGTLPMSVASGGNRKNVHRILKAINLFDAFDHVLTSDDDLEHKPNPGIFLEAARRMGVPPERCQVFEDGEPGFVAARAAGMILSDVREFCLESFHGTGFE